MEWRRSGQTQVGAAAAESTLACGNIFRAPVQVAKSTGCGGIDGMRVGDLPACLEEYWPRIHGELRRGRHKPQLVESQIIPKPVVREERNREAPLCPDE